MSKISYILRGGDEEIFDILHKVITSNDPNIYSYVKEFAKQLEEKIKMTRDLTTENVYQQLLDAFAAEFTSGDKPIPNKLEKLDNKIEFAMANIGNYKSFEDMMTDYKIYSLFKDRDKDFSKGKKCEDDVYVYSVIHDAKATDEFVRDVINEGVIYALNNIYSKITPQEFYYLCKLMFYIKLFENIKCVRNNGTFYIPQLGISKEDCESDTEDGFSAVEKGLHRFKYVINGDDIASKTLRKIYNEMPCEYCEKDPLTWNQQMKKK